MTNRIQPGAHKTKQQKLQANDKEGGAGGMWGDGEGYIFKFPSWYAIPTCAAVFLGDWAWWHGIKVYNEKEDVLKYKLGLHELHPSIDWRTKHFIMNILELKGENSWPVFRGLVLVLFRGTSNMPKKGNRGDPWHPYSIYLSWNIFVQHAFDNSSWLPGLTRNGHRWWCLQRRWVNDSLCLSFGCAIWKICWDLGLRNWFFLEIAQHGIESMDCNSLSQNYSH